MKKLLTLVLLLALMIAACSSPSTTSDADDAVAEETVRGLDESAEEQPEEEVDLVGLEDASTAADDQATAELTDAASGLTIPEIANAEVAGVTELSDELLALLPDFAQSDIQTTASGLQYVVLQAGEGDAPAAGDSVQAHYTGYLVNGEKFDSSLDRGVPFSFPLGQQRVIGGWDEGFALLNPGAKALLIIPPDLGYGPVGAPPSIPGDATLVFEVELIDVTYARKPIEVADEDFTETESGLRYYDLEVGDGASPQEGEVVAIEFALWDSVTGELYGSSEQVGQPLSFPLGRDQMFAAMEEAISSMQVGGSRQLVIAGDLLAESGLPTGNPVIFEIELVGISEGPKADPEQLAEDAYTVAEGDVRWADITVGDGVVLEAGQVALVNYTLWLEDGQQVDSSLYRQRPEQFPVGASQFPGWNEGLDGIAVGGVRQVIVPAELVGDIGLGEPQDLIFEVEVLEIVSQ